MKPTCSRVTAGLMLTWLLSAADPLGAATLVDDRAITIQSASQVEAKRRVLIQYVWGEQGFPADRVPSLVRTNVASPVRQLTRLARVDEFRLNQAPGLEGMAYHFMAEQPNGQLVVLHHGHACTLDDDPSPENAGLGMQRTIQALLGEGYGVLGVFMPHMRPGDCTGGHNAMFEEMAAPKSGSPLQYFLEPTALSLNYLKTRSREGGFPEYQRFHMIGLSGGGWTTTVYAALDPAIQYSFSVAGTIPLYLRSGGSVGDREQFEPSFYGLAGYPDLYVLGSHGIGRSQWQILLRRDDCCFGVAQHDAAATGLPYDEAMGRFEKQVQSALEQLGPGSFSLEIDEIAPSHMISHYAIEELILPALRRLR